MEDYLFWIYGAGAVKAIESVIGGKLFDKYVLRPLGEEISATINNLEGILL
jgi:hypothetical protein